MKNYLKIEVGSRGEIEEVKWFENKTFEEIVEIGKKEFEEYKEWLLGEYKKDGEEEEGLSYIEEFCSLVVKDNVGVEMSKSEELGCGYYSEDLVKELVGKDLDGERNFELIEEVNNKVSGICWMDDFS
jgi:hypothetical protein